MAATDELEDSLFASLLSKPKTVKRRTSKSTIGTQQEKPNDVDDLLDLLSESESPIKQSSTTKPTVEAPPNEHQPVQFGAYTPSSSRSRPLKGPLELPVSKSSPTKAVKSVHFVTPAATEAISDSISFDDPLTPTVANGNKEPISSNVSEEHVMFNESTPSIHKPMTFSKEQDQEQLSRIIKSMLNDELTKRDEAVLSKLSEVETAHKSEHKRLEEMLSNLCSTVTESMNCMKIQMLDLQAAIKETNQSLTDNMSVKQARSQETVAQSNLSDLLQQSFSQLKEEQSSFLEKYEKHFSDLQSMIEGHETHEKQLLNQQQRVEEERQKVYQLLTKFEVHICQKERELEQRHWSVSQLEARVNAQLSAFQDEKHRSMKFIDEQKQLLQKTKEEFLREQQDILKDCYSQKLSSDMTKEIEHKMRQELAQKNESFANAQLSLEEERIQLEREKQKIRQEKERLQFSESDLNLKAVQMSEIAEVSQKMYYEGQRSLEEARALEKSLKAQFEILREHQMELQQKERQLVMDRVTDMREHHSRLSPIQNESRVVSAPPTVSSSVLELKRLELSESLQKLMQRIDKDDNNLVKEQEFLHIVQTPPSSLGPQ